MSDLMEYKCPACGGAMEFDTKSQKLKCPYCDTEMSVDEFQVPSQEEQGQNSESGSTDWTPNGGIPWEAGETEGMRVYSCKSCGGEIIAGETTAASACPFCGNQVTMKGQFAGDLKPDYIIPFKLDKKAAKKAYHKHLQGKKFLPKVFRSENHIDEIKGIYVPFWVFDADVYADISYNAEKTRSWEEKGMEYTEHQYFEVHRSGSVSYRNVPTDCSRKMDDTLMESIEPYRFEEAVPFNPAFLAGYAADRYDVTKEECVRRADKRIQNSAELSFRATIQGYQNVSMARNSIRIRNARYWYTLYPVWLLNTTWNGQKYIFAMNGQTGKMVGDLPMDKKEFWKYTAAWGIGISAALCVIQLILTFA